MSLYVRQESVRPFLRTLLRLTDYLVDNGLYPATQLTTDDYMGVHTINTNLAVSQVRLAWLSFVAQLPPVGIDTRDVAAVYNQRIRFFCHAKPSLGQRH